MSAKVAYAPARLPNGDWILPDFEFEPVYLGPSWQRDESGSFVLPQWTLGWQVIAWAEDNLPGLDGQPRLQLSNEQKRIILWWYAVDRDGNWVYHDGILQRLKGWGKDPFLAVLALVELIGPCRFRGWATRDMPELGLVDGVPAVQAGDPVATECTNAWVQIAAVSKKQTENTMSMIRQLCTEDLKTRFRLSVNKEIIYALGGVRKLEALTSNWRAMEGNRPTFAVRNETHHWIESNDGIGMDSVIGRNLKKIDSARGISITNAYAPHENSVAQIQREAWEAEEAGINIRTGVMYDSIEASSEISLRPPMIEDKPDEFTDDEWDDWQGAMIRAWLTKIVLGIRGDSSWLNPRGPVLDILGGRTPVSQSKRWWLNVISTSEDAWVDHGAVAAAISPQAAANRNMDSSPGELLRAGWLPMPDEPIVMFGDGSKSNDSTALVGCRLSDGYTFLIGVWQAPAQARNRKNDWLAPRSEVHERVREAHERFDIKGFWFDPSHAKDDSDSSRYWDGYVDTWMREFGHRYDTTIWPVKTGLRKHAVMFDMTSPERQQIFVSGAEITVEELEQLDDIEEFDPAFEICGHPALVEHMKNARQYPTSWGISLAKDGSESTRKIDIAVCVVGARTLRRAYLNGVDEEEERSGEVWGYGF